MNLFERGGASGALLLVALIAGCTTKYYRKSADHQVYGVINAKSSSVPNMDPKFTIEQTNTALLEGFPIATNVSEFLGPDGQRERGARVLNLEQTLDIAIHSSRSYQSRKEQLYLSALSLTLARHQFTPLFSASGTVEYNVERVAGLVTNNIVENRS